MINQCSPDIRLGAVLHRTIKEYVSMENNADIADNFSIKWMVYKKWKLDYSEGEDWDLFHNMGIVLVKQFEKEYIKRAISPLLSENKLTDCSGKIEQPDFIGEDNDGLLIVDFKYGRPWTQEMVDTDEQLTRYAKTVSEILKEPPPIRVAICNLNKTTRGIGWFFSLRTSEQIDSIAKRERRNMAIFDDHSTTNQSLTLGEFAGGIL